jgi:hypothetical protein
MASVPDTKSKPCPTVFSFCFRDWNRGFDEGLKKPSGVLLLFHQSQTTFVRFLFTCEMEIFGNCKMITRTGKRFGWLEVLHKNARIELEKPDAR